MHFTRIQKRIIFWTSCWRFTRHNAAQAHTRLFSLLVPTYKPTLFLHTPGLVFGFWHMSTIPGFLQATIVLLCVALFCMGLHCISVPQTASATANPTKEHFGSAGPSSGGRVSHRHTSSTRKQQNSETQTSVQTTTETATNSMTKPMTKTTMETTSANKQPLPIHITSPAGSSVESLVSDPRGYTITSPSTWSIPHKRDPVCIPAAHPVVMPTYTSGVPLHAPRV